MLLLEKRVEARRDHPAKAIRPALVIERLHQTGLVTAAGRSPVEAPLAQAQDPAGLLREFATSDLMHLLIEPAKAALPDRWQEIFEANKDKIKDPNAIEVGQKLQIP